MRIEKNNFVIGATGYIGNRIFKKLKKTSVTIGTSTKNLDGFVNFNLSDPSSFNYGLINPLDSIFFVSAISSPDNMEQAREINVVGTEYFINEAIKKGAKIIFFSSDTVYGESSSVCNESSICNPIGEYALMKKEIENAFINNNLFKSIRLSYVFSKKDKLTRHLIECHDKDESAKLFHPFIRSFIYLDDVVEAVISLSQKWDNFPYPVINLGGPQMISRVDFAEILKTCALPRLKFEQTLPAEEFFLKRPKIINMESPYLNQLLSKPANLINEAVRIEFSKDFDND
jgi:dTDP-4-dehydrorhamnose reductase